MKIIATPELTAILNYILQNKRYDLLIHAFAGTGKTTALLEISKLLPDEKICYFAFNGIMSKSLKSKIEKWKIGKNIDVFTFHAFALKYLVDDELVKAGKINYAGEESNISQKEFARLMPQPHQKFTKESFFECSNYVHKLIGNYLNTSIGKLSSFPEFKKLISFQEFSKSGMAEQNNSYLLAIQETMKRINFYAKQAQKLSPQQFSYLALQYLCTYAFNNIFSLKNDVKLTHDYYFKNAQLAGVDFSALGYDRVVVDEVQDNNPPMLAMIRDQLGAKVPVAYVGDQYQQIYSFRGSINTIELLKTEGAVSCLPLSQSFRCADDIAYMATLFLRQERKEVMQIKGVRTPKPLAYEPIKEDEARTIIFRGNASIYLYLMKEMIHDPEKLLKHKVKVVNNGGGGIEFAQKRIASLLQSAIDGNVPDDEMGFMGRMFEKTGSNDVLVLKEAFDNVQKIVKGTREANATLCLTTVHQAKGLEWDNVILGDDFVNLYEKNKEADLHDDQTMLNEEKNIFYVAMTRARTKLSALSPDSYAGVFLRSIKDEVLNYISSEKEYYWENGYSIEFGSNHFIIRYLGCDLYMEVLPRTNKDEGGLPDVFKVNNKGDDEVVGFSINNKVFSPENFNTPIMDLGSSKDQALFNKGFYFEKYQAERPDTKSIQTMEKTKRRTADLF